MFYKHFTDETSKNDKYTNLTDEKGLKSTLKSDKSPLSFFWMMCYAKMTGDIHCMHSMNQYFTLLLETQEISLDEAAPFIIVLHIFSQEEILHFVRKFGYETFHEMILKSSTKNECLSFLVASMKNANAYPQIENIIDFLSKVCEFDIEAIVKVKEQISKSLISFLLKETNMELCKKFTNLLEKVIALEGDEDDNDIETLMKFRINDEEILDIIRGISELCF
ncbi:hypothetical protein GPJ56_002840 [Histomonas meleagridis]|uniref:uncharacterized protein n=1 Tax=Histomonas meleagridis TaxID=135588 RepID=UPI00355AC4F7|nr:hypothetical protein GPJ56_002840 [Histomonas meleagridis]KAH0806356.1 hypothetical protein GO595_001044 [Histomonas meleagridis]